MSEGEATAGMEDSIALEGEKVKVMNGVKDMEEKNEVKLQNGDTEKSQINGDIKMDDSEVSEEDHNVSSGNDAGEESKPDKSVESGSGSVKSAVENSAGSVENSSSDKSNSEDKDSEKSEIKLKSVADEDDAKSVAKSAPKDEEAEKKDEPMEVEDSSKSDEKSDSDKVKSDAEKESADDEKMEEGDKDFKEDSDKKIKDDGDKEVKVDGEKKVKDDGDKEVKVDDEKVKGADEKDEVKKEDAEASGDKDDSEKVVKESKEGDEKKEDSEEKDENEGTESSPAKGKKRKDKSDDIQEIANTRQLRVRKTPKKYSEEDDDIKIEKEVIKDDSGDEIQMIEESDPLALSDADVKKAQLKDKKEAKNKDPNVIIIDTNTLLKNQGNLAAAVAQSSSSTNVSTTPSVSTVSVATGTHSINAGVNTSPTVSNVNIQTAIQAITGGVPAQGLQSAYITALQQVLLAQGGQVPMNSQHLAQLQQYYNSLGHLQDDAYVIEAPSFIVPYVMEGKPKEPIKAFLKRINKEMDEFDKDKKKEEEKKKADEEKEKRAKERKEKGEPEEEQGTDEEDSKKKEEESVEKMEVTESEDTTDKDKKDEKEEKKDEKENKEDAKEGKETENKEKDEKEVTKDEKDDTKEETKVDDTNSTKASKESSTEADKENSNKGENKENRTTDTQTDKADDKDKSDSDSVVDLEKEDKNAEDLSYLGKWEPYYKSTLGKFILDLGLTHAQEFLQSDLLRMQKKKIEKMKTAPSKEGIMAIKLLEKQLDITRKKHVHLRVPLKICRFCNFKTESEMVMDRHLESPHMVNYTYKCNFCEFETRGPQVILFHMEAEHNIRGRLERAPAFFQCSLCPYEDNNKSKMTRHSFSCAKKYKPEKNCELADWEPPAKIPKIHRGRPNTLGKAFEPVKMPNLLPKGLQGMNINLSSAVAANLLTNASANSAMIAGRGRGRPVGSYKTTGQVINQGRGGTGSLLYSARGVTASGNLVQQVGGNSQQFTLGNQMFHSTGRVPRILPSSSASNVNLIPGLAASSSITIQSVQSKAGNTKSPQQPSISITPLPRGGQQPQNITKGNTPTRDASGKPSFVICEICDGYIKDLEQLRNHMNLIHKVKIHPKMIYNRPPLNCQKCQHRFFTDQGLERHLLGTHGLVTSSMQEAANKGKDAGRCPICGKVFQWKLLNHVSRDHKMTLKPAHLSYKCTVCTATFNMYRLFENHVYSAHSVVNKNKGDNNKKQASGGSGSSDPPLKINDEITIIPQPAAKAAKSDNNLAAGKKSGNSPSVSKEITITKVGARPTRRSAGSSVEVISLDESPKKAEKRTNKDIAGNSTKKSKVSS